MPRPRHRFLNPLLVGVFLTSLAATQAQSQLDTLGETVEVRVVNVDVIATDAGGEALENLKREDFRLIVNGQEAPIEYFSAYQRLASTDRSGRSGKPGASAQASAVAPPDANLPLLIIDYDARFSRPGEARRSFEQLEELLPEMLASTRAIMIARQGMNLVVEQRFTRDADLIGDALGRLAGMKVPNLNSADRKLLISRLERATDPELAGFGEEDQGVQDVALEFLQQVRAQSEIERHSQSNAIAQLEALIASLSGLPGRKAILYLGPGIQPQPAESLFRIWWAKYRSIAPSLGIFSIESEMGLDIAATRLSKLLEKANEAQVAFYGLDPRGVRAQESVEFESIAASNFTESETRNAQEWILSLSRATGGAGRINSADLRGLVAEMTSGFRNYYSLGFAPAQGFPDSGKIRVELTREQGRLRHFDRYVTVPGSRRLAELTVAALLTEVAVNPMEIQVEMEDPEHKPDGTYAIKLLIKIPIASLTLVPEGTRHVGRLSVVVQAQAQDGALSEASEGVVPIELENDTLLTSLNGMAGYRLELRVSPGEQRIAIGVRDEIAQRDSAVRMVVQAGRPS